VENLVENLYGSAARAITRLPIPPPLAKSVLAARQGEAAAAPTHPGK
jgi:hypothetical protein